MQASTILRLKHYHRLRRLHEILQNSSYMLLNEKVTITISKSKTTYGIQFPRELLKDSSWQQTFVYLNLTTRKHYIKVWNMFNVTNKKNEIFIYSFCRWIWTGKYLLGCTGEIIFCPFQNLGIYIQLSSVFWSYTSSAWKLFLRPERCKWD